MSSVLRSKINNKQSTAFLVNETDLFDSELYDESGASLPEKYIASMNQISNKVDITTGSDYLELHCNASKQDWFGSDNQYAYSNKTTTAKKPFTVTFTTQNCTSLNDWAVGFCDASKVGLDSQTYNFFPNWNGSASVFDYGFYFWSTSYTPGSVFKMQYDGNGTLRLYVNNTLVKTTNFTFNSVFPNGLKLFTVFNNGGGPANYDFTVRFSTVGLTNPARSLLCRNMGKQYVISDDTYLKVQTLDSAKRNFYIKFNNASYNKFASYNL